jgi:UDP-N-acetyl-D-mannosaminuronic acid dehydrogenase
MLNQLATLIEHKTAVVGVIGLGYVGLPVACMFAKAGFQTIGVDIAAERVEAINAGKNPIQGKEPGLSELVAQVVGNGRLRCATAPDALSQADAVLISVQTPIEEEDHRPKYTHLIAALTGLGKVMKSGVLVIIESTLAPKTMHQIVIPTLEKASGKTAGEEFWVGHCPERVMPGKLLHNITHMSRVMGGLTPATATVMSTLYRHIVQGELDQTDLLTAELVKTTENAYRDVQIAFVNEIALICEALGGDVWEVRELVNKSPGRNLLYPGAGVGGHCIPKDPWLLIANMHGTYDAKIIPAARHLNRSMPLHVVALTEKALAAHDTAFPNAVIAVLGYAYLANSDDTRDTPSQTYIEEIKKRGAIARIHDPYVEDYNKDLVSVLWGADAAVILVAHDEYLNHDWHAALGLLRHPILIDSRHVLPDDFKPEGAHIHVLGRL